MTSTFRRHTSCPSCGSSDANAEYDDGHTHCFRCRTTTSATTGDPLPTATITGTSFIDVETAPLTKRRINAETCRHWGYGVSTHRGKPVQVAQYRDADGKLVGQKIRTADKDFRWIGSAKDQMYGRHLWRDSGRMIVVTEGEIDALSVSQVQQLKYPVASVPNGAQSAAAAFRANLEWLERFERVVIWFDSDDPGRAAAKECAELITPGKAFIVQVPGFKDANEMLVAGKIEEMVSAVWGAREYRPDGVLGSDDLRERMASAKKIKGVPFPWKGLNDLTDGIRRGEIVTICAGSGVGKTEVVRTVVASVHDRFGDERIGIMSLEETVERTTLGLMGLRAGRRLHLDPDQLPRAERDKLFASTVGSGRYFLYEHKGKFTLDGTIAKVRYLARGCGCTLVVVDNLTIVSSGSDADDERRSLDLAMTQLSAVALECNIAIIVVHHLKRPGSTSERTHEEGGRTSLAHLRGSGSIGYFSNTVIGLERNQQASEPTAKNTTRIRVLKCRHTGLTGLACCLTYSHETGLLTEAALVEDGETPTKGKEDF